MPYIQHKNYELQIHLTKYQAPKTLSCFSLCHLAAAPQSFAHSEHIHILHKQSVLSQFQRHSLDSTYSPCEDRSHNPCMPRRRRPLPYRNFCKTYSLSFLAPSTALTTRTSPIIVETMHSFWKTFLSAHVRICCHTFSYFLLPLFRLRQKKEGVILCRVVSSSG